MKRFLPAAFVAMLGVVMFASCNKDYVCTCTVNTSGKSHVISDDLGKASKSDAQRSCDALRTFYTDTTSAVTADCHL